MTARAGCYRLHGIGQWQRALRDSPEFRRIITRLSVQSANLSVADLTFGPFKPGASDRDEFA